MAEVKSNKRSTQYGQKKPVIGGSIGGGILGGGILGGALNNPVGKSILGGGLLNRPKPSQPYKGGGSFNTPQKQGGWSKDFTQLFKSLPKTVTDIGTTAAGQFASQDRTPFDDLASLIGGMGGGFDPNSVQVDTSAYDNQEKTARQNGADADAKLQAMYRQLAQSYLDDNAGTKAAYDRSAGALSQASDQAASEVKQAASSSTSDLVGMLSKLGIQDTGKVLANKGTTLAGDTNAVLNGIAANKGANLAANESNSAAAQEYNRNISSAANLEGTTQRAENQQNLSKVLQSIAAARTNAVNQAKQSAAQAAASSQSNAFSNALQLAQAQEKWRGDQADRQLQMQQGQAKQDSSDFNAAQGLNKQNTNKSAAIASAIQGFMRNGMSYEDALKRAQALFG